MHDLNDALDELRHVIPYAHSPSVRKLSKIATLLLAKNYILMQTNALNELKRVLICVQQHSSSDLPQNLSASLATILSNTEHQMKQQQQQQQQSTNQTNLDYDHSQSPGGATSAGRGGQAATSFHSLSATDDGATISALGGSASGRLVKSERVNQSNSNADGDGPLTGAFNQMLREGEASEQQNLSVQHRRRKYNMLMNRILGDVAAQQHQLMTCIDPFQHLIMPSGAASNSLAQVAPSLTGETPARSADFCQTCDQVGQLSQSSLGVGSDDGSSQPRCPTEGAADDFKGQTKGGWQLKQCGLARPETSLTTSDDCSSPVSVGSPTPGFFGDQHQQTAASCNLNGDQGNTAQLKPVVGKHSGRNSSRGNGSSPVRLGQHQRRSSATAQAKEELAGDGRGASGSDSLTVGRGFERRSDSASTIVSMDEAEYEGDESGANDWPGQRDQIRAVR